MIRLSLKEAKKMGLIPAKVSKAKYHNKKKIIDGIKFDSIKEANYFCELKLLQRAGEVISIELQPRFTLIKPKIKNGHKIRGLYYKADFKVKYKDGHTEIIDVKGARTRVYINKIKLLFEIYPDINFKEI